MTKELVLHEWNQKQMEIIKKSIAPGATDDELSFFAEICKRRKLDPFVGQIRYIKRRRREKIGDNNFKWVDYWVIQTSVDGLRAIAERTGKLAGINSGPIFKDEKIVGAWAEVHRHDWKFPARVEIAFDEFVQTYDGKPQGLWASKPRFMIEKCAEAAALRRAFPEDLSGLYDKHEFDKDDGSVSAEAVPASPVPLPALPAAPMNVTSVATEDTGDADAEILRDVILAKKDEFGVPADKFQNTLEEFKADAKSDLSDLDLESLRALWERVKMYGDALEKKKAKHT